MMISWRRWASALALVLAVSGTASAGIHDGLLNYWNLDGNFDDTAGSLSGNVSTNADNGSQPGTSVSFADSPASGQYAVFNGDDSAFIEVPNSDDIVATGESLSISAWLNVNQFDQSWQALIAHGESNDYRVARRDASDIMSYAGGVGDIPTDNTTGPNVNDGNWHHLVAISPAGGNAELWVDGALVSTGGATSIADNGSGRLMIGGNPDTAGDGYRTWDGGIDDVGMWNRALTGAEIGAIYAGGLNGVPLSSVPEPSSAVLALLSLSGLGLFRRRGR
ncbi:MAG: LamG domain-containing protein [Planctomycetales bacterium]|nr:LamG domain-containing protein [Planctomycetales bacterium]